jgi:hypothetical protein
MLPSTVEAAPAPTCTWQVVIPVEIVEFDAVTVYPLAAGVIDIVLPVDTMKLLAVPKAL